LKNKTLIIIISIALPLAVAILFNVKLPNVESLSFLPPIYAGINSITVFTLIFAVIAIKKNRRKLHEMLVKTSLALSTLFLLMYIAYHITSDPTKFGGDETTKIIYLVILISHIILSVTIIPLVLITYNRALLQEFDKHKKIARITFPLWLYVAISGVIVYWMISPYYI
jgi:putative membrane protein